MKIFNQFTYLLLFTSNISLASTIQKEEWLDYMKSALPSAFCNSTQYFRACFKVTEADCNANVRRATDACARQMDNQIPAFLSQPEDGTYWGTKVGECATEVYESTFINYKVTNAECGETSNANSNNHIELIHAEINLENLEIINNSEVFNDSFSNQLSNDLRQCKKNKVCQSKVIYEAYDKAFLAVGASQIGTAINFLHWTEDYKKTSNNRQSAYLSMHWGEILMGTFMCMESDDCVNWLVEAGKVSKQEVESFKALTNKL